MLHLGPKSARPHNGYGHHVCPGKHKPDQKCRCTYCPRSWTLNANHAPKPLPPALQAIQDLAAAGQPPMTAEAQVSKEGTPCVDGPWHHLVSRDGGLFRCQRCPFELGNLSSLDGVNALSGTLDQVHFGHKSLQAPRRSSRTYAARLARQVAEAQARSEPEDHYPVTP